jgi:hypothetical protein
MAVPVHTYGSTCLLSSSKEDLTALRSSPTPPKVHAQFFYTSSLLIDDPLTPLPAPSTSSASAHTKSSPQPFSAKDNIALEEAWRVLREARNAKLAQDVNKATDVSGKTMGIPLRGQSSSDGIGVSRTRSSLRSHEEASNSADIPTHDHEPGSSGPKRRDGSPVGRASKSTKRKSGSSPGAQRVFPEEVELPWSQGEPSSLTNITGSPFVRAPTRRSRSPSRSRSKEDNSRQLGEGESSQEVDIEARAPTAAKALGTQVEAYQSSETLDATAHESEGESVQFKVPVGVSRLHLVELPNLKVKAHPFPDS